MMLDADVQTGIVVDRAGRFAACSPWRRSRPRSALAPEPGGIAAGTRGAGG